MKTENPVNILYQASSEADVVSTFLAISDSGRYSSIIMYKLAKIITGTSGASNKDSAIYELCHLVNMLDACGYSDEQSRMLFLLGDDNVSKNTIENKFNNIEINNLWRREGFSSGNDGIRIKYDADTFLIRFSRIPVLMAFYEFLSSMEEWSFYIELNELFNNFCSSEISIQSIKRTTGKIASRFRKYRHTYLDWAKHEERFEKLANYLTKRAEKEKWNIDNDAILEFWIENSIGKDYKAYKTVFDAFITLSRVIQKSENTLSIESSSSIGMNKDIGEVQIDRLNLDIPDDFVWENPMNVFDKSELNAIKFFKQSSEKKPLEQIMRYGPDAIRYLLAFLRLESFGGIQSAITNDLQMKRGRQMVEKRLNCDDALSYEACIDNYAELNEHLERLSKAVLHLISSKDSLDENIIEIKQQARKTFEGLKRKGFESDELDEDEKQNFSLAAEALVRMSEQLQTFRKHASELDIQNQYLTDKPVFANQFNEIYGEIR